jgi:predicted AAA+ superfamily ATPase
MVQMLAPWSANLGKRLVKSPKVMLNDTGLVAHLVGANSKCLTAEPALFGALLENFVVNEVRKQLAWSETLPGLYHFRTQAGQEVDIVLEDAAGRVVGIEVKAAAGVGAKDFGGLRGLAEALGDRFVRGIVIYTGREEVGFGNKLVALPISALWRLGAQPHTVHALSNNSKEFGNPQ